MISKKALKTIRKAYPPGTRVELVKLSNSNSGLKPGDTGTLIGCDDVGTLHIELDKGTIFSIKYGEDFCKPVLEENTLMFIINNQISALNKSGKTNMFDITDVEKAALAEGYIELLALLKENPNKYFGLVLTV